MKIDIGGWKHQSKHNTIGWTIVDVNPECPVQCVLGTDTLPYGTNTVDAIYTSHTLEHVLPHTQSFAYSEMFRALKPGGLIRIVVPDIEIAIKKYVANDMQWFKQSDRPSKVPSLPSDVMLSYLSGFFFTYYEYKSSNRTGIKPGGHVMPYSYDMAAHYLAEAGFTNITRKSFEDTSDPFTGVDIALHKDHSVYVEAKK